jgi:hypothetical protein
VNDFARMRGLDTAYKGREKKTRLIIDVYRSGTKTPRSRFCDSKGERMGCVRFHAQKPLEFPRLIQNSLFSMDVRIGCLETYIFPPDTLDTSIVLVVEQSRISITCVWKIRRSSPHLRRWRPKNLKCFDPDSLSPEEQETSFVHWQ